MIIRYSVRLLSSAFLAALCGALIAEGEAALALAGVVGGLTLIAIAYRPDFGALLFLLVVAAVPHNLLFERGIPLSGGTLKVTDLILIATLGSWLAQAAVRHWEVRLPSGATSALLLYGIAWAVISILVAYGSPPKSSLTELRPLLSFLLVFPIVDGVRSLREVEIGLGLFLAAASVACLITLWRYAHGEGGVASYTNGAIRVEDSFFMFPMLAAIWVAALAPTIRAPTTIAALSTLAILSLGALFFTFQRSAWLAFLVALALLVIRLAPGMRLRLVLRGVPVLLAGLVAVLAVNAVATRSASNPLHSAATRLSSVADFNKDVSGRYRLDEWLAAGHAIARHPLAGIGLGNSISFWSPAYSPTTNTNGGITTATYIHSSYIWFALKLGLPGALAFIGLLLLQVGRAQALLRQKLSRGSRRLLLGALASLVALLVVSIGGSHLNADFSTPYIAAVIALIELVPLVDRETTGRRVARLTTEPEMSAA